jgi:6-phosphogluconolactonase
VAERSPSQPVEVKQTDDAASEAGRAVARALGQVLAKQEIARLAIPGGSALTALDAARKQLGEAWVRVAITWVDERCVPESDAESNRGSARRRGLLNAPAPSACLALYEDGETPEQAVTRASRDLRDEFSGTLDVVLLGMGEDGHVASLFPGSAPQDGGWVAHVSDSPKPPADRITLTRPILSTARATILLATGEAKRGALTRLISGDDTLPAHGLPGLSVFTDVPSPLGHEQPGTERTRSKNG